MQLRGENLPLASAYVKATLKAHFSANKESFKFGV